jgi:molybdopterin-guanine dinucleotide biosynthesis protein A
MIPGTMIRQKTNNISGVVLAGGLNRRFGGKIKSNAVVGGEKIIERIIKTITPVFEEIIIVTNTPQEFAQFSGFIITKDHFLKVGPLGGIHAAMKASSKESVFIFAGDMPFLDKELIINQIGFYNSSPSEALIPEINDKMEPLHGIYKNLLSDRLEEYLSSEKDYAIRDFLEEVNVDYFRLRDSERTVRAFTNINTLQEAEKAVRNSEI